MVNRVHRSFAIWQCKKCGFYNYKNKITCYNCAHRRKAPKVTEQLRLFRRYN